MFSKITSWAAWPYRQVFTTANLLTLTGLASAQLALLCVLKGQHILAISLLCFQIVMDTLDGRVAKKFSSQNQLGTQLDSFSDLLTISAVASLVYKIHSESLWITLCAILLVISATIRLSVFNTFNQKNKITFIGLPTTAVSGCAILLLVIHYLVLPIPIQVWSLFLTITSLLMLSPLKINRLWK